MNIIFLEAFLAGAIATLISAPTFADEPVNFQDTSNVAGKTESAVANSNKLKYSMIYMRSPQSLLGEDIVGLAGEQIGSIKSIVQAKDRRSAYAVISTGGIFGIGARKILVSLNELNKLDDKLQMRITQKRLKTRPEYQSDKYVELTGDKPISEDIYEFSAFETRYQFRGTAVAPKPPVITGITGVRRSGSQLVIK